MNSLHKGVIAVLALVVFAVGGIIGALSSKNVQKHAATLTSQKVSEIIGINANIGNVSAESFRSIKIENITLYDKEGNTMLETPAVLLTLRLLSAITDSPSAVVDKIVVVQPKAYIKRRDDGNININDIKLSSEGESSFKSSVIIEDGTIKGEYEGKTLVLEDVNSTLDIDGNDISYDARAKSFDASFESNGKIGDDISVNLTGKDIDIENYHEFLSILKDKEILDENIKINGGKIPQISLKAADSQIIAGSLKLTGGDVTVFDTVISEIDGSVNFSDKELLVEASANSNGQKANVAGTIDFNKDAASPSMDLAVKSDGFDVSEVLTKVPVAGAIKVNAKVLGTFKNPQIKAELSQDAGEVEGILLKDTKAKVRVIGKKIYVDDLNSRVFDGSLTAQGELDTSDLSYMAHLKCEDIRAEYISNFAPNAGGIYGNASADVNIHGKSDELTNLMMYGNVRGNNLNYQAMPIERINGSFYAKGGEIYLDYLSMILGDKAGELGIEGKFLPGSEIDVALYGQALNISAVHKLEPNIIGEGLFDVRAKCTGTVDNPNLNIRLASVFGSLFNQKFDSMRAVVVGSPERLNIDEFAMLKNGDKVWEASGFFGITGEKRLGVDVLTDGARVENIVKLFTNDAQLTGNLKNTVHIGGTLNNPEAKGHLDIIRGSFNGMLIQSLNMDYHFDDDVLNVDGAKLMMPVLDLEAKGKLNVKNKGMDFDIDVSDIDMKRISNKFPYPVDGHGTFIGKVGGSIDNPNIYAALKSDELMLNGVTLNNIRGSAHFNNKILKISNLGAEEDETNSTFLANVVLDFANNLINGTMSIENGDIESLLLLGNSQSKHLKGNLDARLVTTGELDAPRTRLEGVIKKGVFAGYGIRDVVLRLSMNPKEFNIERFSGYEGEQGTLNGSLSLTPDGGLKGNIDGANIDFGMFTNLAGLDAKVVGLTNIKANFRGNVHNPAADILIEVKGGGILGATFDTLNGTLSLDKGSLNVKELVVAKNIGKEHFSASAKGIVPIKSLIDNQGENKNDGMDLTLHLDDANLSLLPALSKAVEWAEGDTDGNLKLTGTLSEPLINGEFAINEGSLKLKHIRKPITNINLKMYAKGREIELQNFSGNMGSGNYLAKGNLRFKDDPKESLEYNFDIDLNALQIDSVYYTGPLSGKLNISQNIIGRMNKRLVPKISGNLNSEYAQIVVPVIPETDTPTPEISLDLNLNFGKRVHLYEPQLYDMYFSGSASFKGTTLHPLSSGTIDVRRGGTIRVSHNTFRINAGEVVFNQIGTFLPTVKFFADTHVGKTKIYVALMGPLGTDKIKPYLTSSPAMSQTEIIRLLTLGTDYQKDSNGVDEMRGIIVAGIQMTVLGEVERELKRGLSLDAFSLAYGSGSTFARHREIDNYYSVSTGKYLNNKWLLRYNQGLGRGIGNYLIGLTYEMDNRTGIIFEHVDGANIVGVEARIRF